MESRRAANRQEFRQTGDSGDLRNRALSGTEQDIIEDVRQVALAQNARRLADECCAGRWMHLRDCPRYVEAEIPSDILSEGTSSRPDIPWRHDGGSMTESRSAAYLHAFGLIVSPMPKLSGGGTLYAEVTPAGSRWLPWPGRTSRWRFEVHEKHVPDEHGVDTSTWAYIDGGSGGGFTLRSCIAKATEAVERFSTEVES